MINNSTKGPIMLRILTALLMGALLLTAAPAVADDSAPAEPFTWTACANDEIVEQGDTRCVWDARHMGNGTGSSFLITKEGFWVKVSHRKAHRMLHRGEVFRSLMATTGWEDCIYTGRWNAPCAWDNQHSPGADLYTNDWSFALNGGSTTRLPHRIAHYMLGY